MIARSLILCAISALAAPAYAQVELKTYADSDGYLDVQRLTCAQLANTFQEDADYLTAWYSGWYNGLGKKHLMLVDRAKSLEHQDHRALQIQSRQDGYSGHRRGLQSLQGRTRH